MFQFYLLQILVMGHSWVSDLERHFQQDWVRPSDATVIFAPFPGANLKTLRERVPEYLDETYTHMVIFSVITEAYYKTNLSNDPQSPGVYVTLPNPTYTNEDFSKRFGEFVNYCRSFCCRLRIILMIPPPLDLVYYNSLLLQNATPTFRRKYYTIPEYGNQQLHQSVINQHTIVRQLRSPNVQWPGKETYPVVYAVRCLNIKILMKYFMSGRVRTLRDKGFLRDGLHPTQLLCFYIWKKFATANLFRVADPESRVPVDSYFVHTEPFMPLEVEEANTEPYVPEVINRSVHREHRIPDTREVTSSAIPVVDLSQPSTSGVLPTFGASRIPYRRSQPSRYLRFNREISPDFPQNFRNMSRKRLRTESSRENSEVRQEVQDFVVYLQGYLSAKGFDKTKDEVKKIIKDELI